MKLHWSPRSPFVRKVMITAHEIGIVSRLDCVRSVAAMTKPHLELMKDNPLSKIPTLVRDDGVRALRFAGDLRIFRYAARAVPKLFPAEPDARFIALRRQALGDGMLDFLILWRGEGDRAHKSEAHLASFAAKRAATLASLEQEADDLAATRRFRLVISRSAVRCRISISGSRRSHGATIIRRLAAWHATFCARPSAKATEAVDDSI